MEYLYIPSDALSFFQSKGLDKSVLARLNELGEVLGHDRHLAFASMVTAVDKGFTVAAFATLENYVQNPDGRSIDQVCVEIDTLTNASTYARRVFGILDGS